MNGLAEIIVADKCTCECCLCAYDVRPDSLYCIARLFNQLLQDLEIINYNR